MQAREAVYAGFGKRFLAALLDGLILSIINWIVGFVIGLILSPIVGRSEGGAAASAGLLGGLVGVLISWLYYAVQESSAKQATIGKQALGIVVTDLDNNRISFVQATIRYFSKILSTLILMIGYLMVLFTEKKQALHDIIAGTLVVNK
ncbi:MAG TPA: RDD family protein [Coleofasciculaceae cyanobacterium]